MATSKPWAHYILTCDLCEKPTQQFCKSCQVCLFNICVKKHSDEFKSLSHEIVNFVERKFQLVFPEGNRHPGQRCEAHCNNCNKPGCCILAGPHKSHNVEELIETFEKRRQETKTKTTEIKEKIIPKCKKENTDIELTMLKTKTHFYGLGKECKSLRQLWHQHVDGIFDKIDFLSKTFKDQNLNILHDHKNKIQNMISKINEALVLNDKVLQSNKLSDVNNYISELNKVTDLSERTDTKMPRIDAAMIKEKELNIEIGNYRATLTQSPESSHSTDVLCLTSKTSVMLMDEVSVISAIPTNCDHLYGIACVGEAEAWIFEHDNNIILIYMNWSIKDTVSTGPKVISVSNECNLLFSISEVLLGTVNLVRTGGTEQLIIAPPHLTPE